MRTEIKYWWHKKQSMVHNILNTGVDVSFDKDRNGKIYVASPKYLMYRECFKPLNEL